MKKAPGTKTATGVRTGARVKVETTKASSGTVQLRLLTGGTPEPDWTLDDRTRKVGRQGVAHAREILRRVAPPQAVRRAS
jgi:hypothetical protein